MPILDQIIRSFIRLFCGDIQDLFHEIRPIFTFDLDYHKKFVASHELIRTCGRLLFYKPTSLISVGFSFVKYMFTGQDPVDICHYHIPSGSVCFVIVGGKSKYDPPVISDKQLERVVEYCEKRNCEIGFHPSFYASIDENLFVQELNL